MAYTIQSVSDDPASIADIKPQEAADLLAAWTDSGDPAPAGNILASLAAKAAEESAE